MTIYTFYSRRPVDVAIIELASNLGIRAGYLLLDCSHSDDGNAYQLITDDRISKTTLAIATAVCQGIDSMWRSL